MLQSGAALPTDGHRRDSPPARAWGSEQTRKWPAAVAAARARPVQVRFATGLSTSEEYVRQEGWRIARLDQCPLHPAGGCGFSRHGTYARVEPPGARVTRYYCRRGGVTIGLIPDCLASRLSSSLDEIEEVAVAARRGESVEEAAGRLRPDVDLPGAVRWTRRRARVVSATLTTLSGLRPDLFAGCQPTLPSFRARLGVERVLVALRAQTSAHLAGLPPPLGFGPRSIRRHDRRHRHQHETGPDPPGTPR